MHVESGTTALAVAPPIPMPVPTPVPTATMNQKNLWVAAGDGDLEGVRVSYLPAGDPLQISPS